MSKRLGSQRVEVSVPLEEGAVIRQELGKPTVEGCERVVLALAGLSSSPETQRVLLTSPQSIPEDAYMHSAQGSAWDPSFTAQVAEEGMRRRLGVMIIHSHPFSPVPRLSPRDRASLDALLPALRATIPTRPHGSIVLGPDWAIGGVVALPSGQLLDVTNAKWVGSPMRKWPLSGSIPKTESMYRSQASLIGERGQFLLSRTTLGIVGVGGGGSHIAQQAARVGFGTIVAIDPDLVEDSNRARMVGSREGDISKPKVGVIRRVVREASKNTNIIIIPEKFPSEKTLAALKECEVIVSCVDTYSARAELNTFSWRHLIPLIDIGIGTEVESSDEGVGLRQLAGHVHVYLPGGPCMWCTGLLSDTRIQLETGGRPEYFRGEGGPGQVISFNGVVASLAVTEAVQLVTGAIFGRHRRLFVQYDGVMPSLPFIDPVRSRSCRVCNGELGRGDTVWK